MKNSENIRLTAFMTIDFEEYVSCTAKAQDQFFKDKLARSASMTSLNPRGLQSVQRANENAVGPDIREL